MRQKSPKSKVKKRLIGVFMASIYFCAHCLDKIRPLHEQFILICDFFFEYNQPVELGIDGVDAEQARKFLRAVYHLEQDGCVVTTETGIGLIAIKPLGFDVAPPNSYIRSAGKPVWCMDERHVHERV